MLKSTILGSNLIEFLRFLRACAELVDSLIFAYVLSENHVFKNTVRLKKLSFYVKREVFLHVLFVLIVGASLSPFWNQFGSQSET